MRLAMNLGHLAGRCLDGKHLASRRLAGGHLARALFQGIEQMAGDFYVSFQHGPK